MLRLRRATVDLLYLLDHGYPRDSAVNFVANHYRLPLEERHLLARCVFSQREAEEHRRKLIRMNGVRGRRLGVDGYNVLITVESLLTGKRVVLCNDGIVRDLRAIFGKYRAGTATPRAIAELVEAVARAKPSEVVIFFDKQVSRSGELAADFRRRIEAAGLRGGALAVGGVDKKLEGFEVVASSDRVVIQRARKVWDIPQELMWSRRSHVLDVKELINNTLGK
ncbi:MAG: DUF434 domain-containing protein [Candidatus Hadarchaeum sp.]|uniref:DUF434 domain-containing protein n=1 Tax=Candidatus Hadarchaeum sp. TaxID=2883567 RepID=UPI003D09AC8C